MFFLAKMLLPFALPVILPELVKDLVLIEAYKRTKTKDANE